MLAHLRACLQQAGAAVPTVPKVGTVPSGGNKRACSASHGAADLDRW